MVKKKLYETSVVFDGGQTDEVLAEHVANLKKLLESFGADIKNVITPGRKKLAYPIENRTIGYHVHVECEMDPSVIKELERQYRLNENVLRYLTIILDKTLLMIRERVIKYGSGISIEKTQSQLEEEKA